MNILESIKEFWAVIAGIVAAIAWFVRIEAKGKENANAIERLEKDIQRDRDATAEMLREIRGDIKTLLRGPRE
jgi:hypothetical protein